MTELGFKTFHAKKEEIERKWYIIDAQGKTLGRLATVAARLLRGKDKPIFTPHVDCGDYVIVINAKGIKVTGDKLKQKKYYRHSGYVGNLKTETLEEKMNRKPQQVVSLAVKGMLPHNRLGRQIFKKLKVYADDNHAHQAQKPEKIEI
ncbi:MAG: 50S ribosomal protein L13 [Actinomycetota bacterium]|nr:50S ribosomal protein L13 [Actinomycetota bacterium]